MSECIFCKIISGDEEGWKVYEDDKVFAFLDVFPVTEGHVIVAYKKHVKDVFELSDKDFLHMAEVAQKISKKMKKKLKANFVNIMTAQSVIKHAFLHVVPRYDYDLMGIVPDMENKRSLAKEEMQLLQKKIKGGLDVGGKN